MRESDSPPPVSDAELHGFVDGELDRGRRGAVQAFLAASPADAARIAMWRRQNESIRAAFYPVETAPWPWSLPLAPGTGAVATTGRAAGGQAPRVPSWRQHWFARLVGLAFASGALLAAGAAYVGDRVNAPDGAPPSSRIPAPAMANDDFVGRAMSALQAFEPPRAAAPSPDREVPGQAPAALILPVLTFQDPKEDLKLVGVRAVPGDQGQMLCVIYATPEAGNVALCAEKAVDQSETAARLAGKFPPDAIYWRQKGANYALTGALPEARLRTLAREVRAQVEAFAGR